MDTILHTHSPSDPVERYLHVHYCIICNNRFPKEENTNNGLITYMSYSSHYINYCTDVQWDVFMMSQIVLPRSCSDSEA